MRQRAVSCQPAGAWAGHNLTYQRLRPLPPEGRQSPEREQEGELHLGHQPPACPARFGQSHPLLLVAAPAPPPAQRCAVLRPRGRRWRLLIPGTGPGCRGRVGPSRSLAARRAGRGRPGVSGAERGAAGDGARQVAAWAPARVASWAPSPGHRPPPPPGSPTLARIGGRPTARFWCGAWNLRWAGGGGEVGGGVRRARAQAYLESAVEVLQARLLLRNC